jgi:hypothetical protein
MINGGAPPPIRNRRTRDPTKIRPRRMACN